MEPCSRVNAGNGNRNSSRSLYLFDRLFLVFCLYKDDIASGATYRKQGSSKRDGGNACCMQKTWGGERMKQEKNVSFEDHRRKNSTAFLKLLKLWHVIVQCWMRFETGNLWLNCICNMEVKSLGDISVMAVGLLLAWAWPSPSYALWFAHACVLLFRKLRNNECGKSCQNGH